MLSRQRQNGRSMIEMLGVLGIMAVITVLSISAYTMAMKNIKTNNAKSDISSIVQQVIAMSDGDYSKWVAGDKTFKSAFVDSGLFKATNAFGEGADTATGTGYTIVGTGSNFTVSATAGDAKECALLASQNWEGGTSPACASAVFSVTY